MLRDEFEALDTIQSFFPLKFPKGAKWEEFTMYCNDCSQSIPSDRIRGYVHKLYGSVYRSVKISYDIEAYGLCPSCDRLSTAKMAFLDDVSVVSTHQKTGEQTVWKAHKPGFLEKFTDSWQSFKQKWKAK